MADYQLTATDSVIRTSDGACIPNDPENRDRAENDAWIKKGGVPDPYVPPAPEALSFQARDLIDQLTVDDLAAIETAVQASPALRLLWLRLRTREGKPVIAEGEAFAQGWAGMTAALGKTRAAEIAETLGFAN